MAAPEPIPYYPPDPPIKPHLPTSDELLAAATAILARPDAEIDAELLDQACNKLWNAVNCRINLFAAARNWHYCEYRIASQLVRRIDEALDADSPELTLRFDSLERLCFLECPYEHLKPDDVRFRMPIVHALCAMLDDAHRTLPLDLAPPNSSCYRGEAQRYAEFLARHAQASTDGAPARVQPNQRLSAPHRLWHIHPLSSPPPPISSLPPLKGEVRWGWGVASWRGRLLCGRRLACLDQLLCPLAAPTPLLVSPLEGGRDWIFLGGMRVRGWALCVARFRLLSPNFDRSSPIHPSPFPGGRLGGGWNAPRTAAPVVRAPIVHIAPTVLPYPRKNESANNAHQPTPHPRPDHPRRNVPEQR